MDGGTYTLLLHRESVGGITVGALGECAFPARWYAYTGSALGSGGFARVDRHRAVASGERDTRHWHIDYLLGDDATTIDTVVTTADDIECGVARRLDRAVGTAVADFGCSDCGCPAHLVSASERETLLSAIERAHERATLSG